VYRCQTVAGSIIIIVNVQAGNICLIGLAVIDGFIGSLEFVVSAVDSIAVSVKGLNRVAVQNRSCVLSVYIPYNRIAVSVNSRINAVFRLKPEGQNVQRVAAAVRNDPPLLIIEPACTFVERLAVVED